MLLARTHKTVFSLAFAGAICLAGAGVVQAATPLRMAGAITGFVTDAAGVPQMGAAVLLFNRQERQFERASPMSAAPSDSWASPPISTLLK